MCSYDTRWGDDPRDHDRSSRDRHDDGPSPGRGGGTASRDEVVVCLRRYALTTVPSSKSKTAPYAPSLSSRVTMSRSTLLRPVVDGDLSNR